MSEQQSSINISNREAARKPFGVSVAATVSVLWALVTAFLALNSWIRAQELQESPTAGFLLFIEVLGGMGVAFALWTLQKWARIAAVGLYALSFLVNFAIYFNEPLNSASAVTLAVPAALIVYLIQPHVVDAFA